MQWLLPIVAVVGTAFLIIARKPRPRIMQYVGFCAILGGGIWGIQNLPDGYSDGAFYGVLLTLPLWVLFGPEGLLRRTSVKRA